MTEFNEARRELVRMLINEGVLRSSKVIRAMLKVPREEFVLPRYRDYAYSDMPLPIGYGQTISAPHMVALMTEELDPGEGDKVLEIGTGSGYQAAVLAEIVSDRGHVWSIERIPGLAEFARENLKRTSYIGRVTVIVGDGTLGYSSYAPYDRIIVTAAAPDIPRALIDQLRVGGKLVIPVGDRYLQRLVTVVKEPGGKVRRKVGIPCVFVPLIGRYGYDEC
ncbi:MAG: protein-L-isoaspartate O-methyltransferase [Desulfurococcales archaeon ex4484_204]|nr:MAG: protein-L-isoaspartate O-methyltransferase [Desulfurococcales archaeon ex4484_204]